MKYKKLIINDEFMQVYDNEHDCYIPVDERNRDYQAYLEWVADGNTADEEII